MIGISWFWIRYYILCNLKAGEFTTLVNATYGAPEIGELETLIKKYHFIHILKYGLEALIIMIMLKPLIINVEITGGSLL